MKWVHASVVAAVVALCSTASAQSISSPAVPSPVPQTGPQQSAEPESGLLQNIQYGGGYYGYRDRGYRGGYRGYGRRYRRSDDGAAIAAGVLGFALGAAIAGSASDRDYYRSRRSDRAWLASCSSRYRSFDPASGTYLGFDGYRHYCR